MSENLEMDERDTNRLDNNSEEDEDEEEDDEEEESIEEEEEASSESNNSSQDLSRHGGGGRRPRQVKSEEEESSDESDHSASELCPAARLVLCRQSPTRTVSTNTGTMTMHNDHQGKSTNTQNNNNNNEQSYGCGDQGNNSSQNSGSDKTRKSSRKRSATMFMAERLDEQDEGGEDYMDDRPIRGTMKVREDTLDGAEAPDTDPPQRRKTIEDISITELSNMQGSLPPAEYPEDEQPLTLLPCITCNRTFNPKALDRHRKVCQKLAESSKNKQVFNAVKQRFEGLDQAELRGFAAKGRAKTPEKKNSKKKTSRWREKHQEFLRTIRTARGSPEGDANDGSPMVPSDYVRCPHCDRHFGPKAADRHIDWCKEQNNRFRRNSADTNLTERLKTRTKYVPPKPGQSGWRAPKKTDVISSIPPPSTTSAEDRKISPPPIAPVRSGTSLMRQHSTHSLGRTDARSFSSLLNAVTNNYASPYGQRGSVVGSPSGYATPSSYSAYGGTSAGGSQTPNLVRSGSFSGSTPGGMFARSASLRVPNQRRTSGGRIARRRDLASDMLASVCLGSSPARGEPEGDEADDFSSRETTMSPPPFSKSLIDSKFDSPFDVDFDDCKYDSKFDSYDTNKYDSSLDVSPSYDPYSAAEMQMQALLGPTKTNTESGGLGAAGLGIGRLGSFLEGNNIGEPGCPMSPTISKRRPLIKINTSLSPASRRSSRQMSPNINDLLSSSPGTDFQSDKRFGTDYLSNKRFWRSSPSPPPSQHRDRWSPSPHSPSQAWSPTRTSPNRWGNESSSSSQCNRDNTNASPSPKESSSSRYGISSGLHSSITARYGTGSSPGLSHLDHRGGHSPSISSTHSTTTRDERFSLSSGGSGSVREERYSSGSLSRDGRFSISSASSSRADRFSTGSNPGSLRGAEDRFSNSSTNTAIHRTLGNGAADVSSSTLLSSSERKSPGEEQSTRFPAAAPTGSTLSSFQALRIALQGDGSASKKYNSRVESSHTKSGRSSSGSSTDSSLPPLSSPTTSVSPSGTAKSLRNGDTLLRGDTVGSHGCGEDTNKSSVFRNNLFRSERSPSIGRDSRSPSVGRDTRSPSIGRVGLPLTLTSGESLEKAISSLSNIAADDEAKPRTGATDSSRISSDSGSGSVSVSASVPRFCHECGHKYPVNLAKFCCQCGCRRASADN